MWGEFRPLAVGLFHLLLIRFLEGCIRQTMGVVGHGQDTGLGVGDWDGFGPDEGWKKGTSTCQLGLADQESELPLGSQQTGGYRQDGLEALDGAEADYVECRREGFGAGGLYIDVRQCKRARDLAEERGFLVIGLDQGQVYLGSPEFDGDAGEAGARAEVSNFNGFHPGGHRGTQREEMASGEEAFAEVAGDDPFFVADGSEIDAGIPTLE